MNPKIFLNEVKDKSAKQYKIVKKIQSLIFDLMPDIKEEFKYRGLLYSFETPVTGIFVYKDHISLEFSNGAKLKDSKKVLEGGGKFRRHIKIRDYEDIENKEIRFYISQLT